MTRVGWRRIVAWLLVALLAWLLLSALMRFFANRGPTQKVEATAQQIAHGRYLTAAADCAACHTAAGGAPFAGGVPLASPFGTIHGTNITPDPETGIGRYTSDDFYHALTKGEARDGHQLYPAMPYVSYKTMAREDSDAIYAYLMNQPAVRQENKKNGVGFPFNIRSGIHAWNWLFAGAEAVPASQGSSPAWRRGQYFVETMGHCGECHSPRGRLGQVDRERQFAGNDKLGRFAAPSLTPLELAERGWDAASLDRYLAGGVSAQAVASDEMLKVVALSTSRLRDADRAAIIAYLVGDKPPSAVALPPPAGNADLAPVAEQRHYLELCAGCHGRDGQGVPHVAPALHGNSSVRDANPHNLIVTILDGLPEHDLPGLERMQDMPGFADDLNDADVAALATWLRGRHGGQMQEVSAAAIAELRNRQPSR
ncbi:cytochrome c [Luteimonas gilva]|uniref:Cytochrome c n=1 Tax=Luteimonas gilva TaxID=2572684 RepID=A0A4U5JS60_9GAMM|nr:cytochrome c [Luteimonas gilva]TKR30857.1 cytochrome c [Luteimonas gilva]